MELPHILLTPIALDFWGQFLLASLLLALVIYWLISAVNNAAVRTRYLALGLIFYVFNVIVLALRGSALTVEQMYWNIVLFPGVAIAVFALAGFVYRMPSLPPAWRREERGVSLGLAVLATWETGYGGYRAWALARGEVHYRPWVMDWALLIAAVWLATVLARQVLRHARSDATHAMQTKLSSPLHAHGRRATQLFLLPMVFLLALAVTNLLQRFLPLPPTLVYYLISLLSMAMLVSITLIYMNHHATKTSFVVQTTSIMIILIILVVTTAGRAVTNVAADTYAANNTRASVSRIHFTPTGAAYAIATHAMPATSSPTPKELPELRPVPLQPDATGMAKVSLPFSFMFFGRPWAAIYIHPAGFLTFGIPQKLVNLEYRYGAVPAIFALYRPEVRSQPAVHHAVTVWQDAQQVRIRWSNSAGAGASDRLTPASAFQVWLYADGAFAIEYGGEPPTRIENGSASLISQWTGAHNGDIIHAPPLVDWQTLDGKNTPMTQTLVANSEFPTRAQLHPLLTQLLFLMVVSVLTAVGAIPLFLRFGFMQPLERLLAGIERMRRGDLTVQIPIHQQSEIGDITAAFNQLVASQRSLLENLEAQVQERTHNLAATNQQLQHAIALQQTAQRALESLNRELDARVQARTRELAESEARFRRVVTSISDHVFALTLNPTTGAIAIDFISPNLPKLLRVDITNLTHFDALWRSQCVLPEDWPIYDQHLADLFAGRDSQVEYRLQQDNGQPVWVHVSVRCERVSATEVRGYGVLSDISTRKQLEQETAARQAFQEIEALRSEWMGNMSHELRTPLGLIKTAVTTLLAKDVTIPPAVQHGILAQINQETDRLTDLVSTLLDLSRLEVARLHLSYTDTNVSAMLREVVDTATLQMQLGSIPSFVLELELATPHLYATIDRERMRRVVQNLLSNAMKFSPVNSRIVISAAATQTHLVITVKDHGIGIDEADYDRVFERYYQVKQPGMHGKTGVGLGLPICREITNAHGGDISLTSRPASKYGESGTTFVVRVPLTPPKFEAIEQQHHV